MMINSRVSPFISASTLLNVSGRLTVPLGSPPPGPASRKRPLLTCPEGGRGGREVARLEADQVLDAKLARAAQPQRLGVQRLLEHRARVAGVAEALAALGAPKNPLQLLGAGRADAVLVLHGEAIRDLHQLGGRVVREGDLAREARPE